MRWNTDVSRVLTALAFALLAGFAHADTLVGRVVAISDGDTLTVLDDSKKQHKIRLTGIDSPEKGQPFGDYCKKSLSDLAYDRMVVVESNKLDHYGRVIGKVLVDAQDVNLEQVRRGCGWHYKKYQNEQSLEDRVGYDAAEQSARNGKVGLWTDRDPVAPWDWRQARKK